ncbi:histidine kinase sensor domain-containing protein [Neptuniibacter sp.]|uniref:sensor histidine kinase n=1 Tax=Neptuniibacter sp. TaxID=1962643 RepID=UPI00260900BD|nr:histidine kinase sensor domain-containing protein [Neptuniibacter sp.]MCP4595277.1 HAMP domain-containing protein [Neptuniibacter sp.]
MNHGLFWKLFAILVAGTVVLFAGIHWLVNHTEREMSYIADHHQQEMRAWANHAESLYVKGDMDELNRWIIQLQDKEYTWVAIVSPELHLIAGNKIDQSYVDEFRLGRSIEWMIHLYHNYNPVMDLFFEDGETHFIIRLPQRMRPGNLWQTTQLMLQVGLPFCVLAVVCLLLYRHLVSPIRKLEKTTRQFAAGNYDVRVRDSLGRRNDELASLAQTFDAMAEHTGGLIVTQRQLIADLSHELRTPITRIEMALNAKDQQASQDSIERIKKDVACIRALSEDALTLAWIDTEKPIISSEPMDLVDLLDSIIDDARFEFFDRRIQAYLPDVAPIEGSNNRVLGQALENVVRNALRYTPVGGQVEVELIKLKDHFQLTIADQGPGVPDEYLEKIFQPFFRVEKERGKDSGGFGLGLALAKRQIEALSGRISAANQPQGGLLITVTLKI